MACSSSSSSFSSCSSSITDAAARAFAEARTARPDDRDGCALGSTAGAGAALCLRAAFEDPAVFFWGGLAVAPPRGAAAFFGARVDGRGDEVAGLSPSLRSDTVPPRSSAVTGGSPGARRRTWFSRSCRPRTKRGWQKSVESALCCLANEYWFNWRRNDRMRLCL